MQNNKKMIQFLESLLEDVKEIKADADKEDFWIITKMNSLQGKIEGAKMALEWIKEEK